jgi:hypothetical protein
MRALVNGDDAVVRSSTGYRLLWEQVARVCGFSASPGKVYDDPIMLNINSREFVWKRSLLPMQRVRARLQTHTSPSTINGFVKTPYVNMGILNGLKRSEGMKRAGDLVETHGQKCTTLINDCPESIRHAVLSQYIHNNEAFLKSLGVPWFLPERLGGIGLPEVGPDYICQKHDYIYIPLTQHIRRPPLVQGGWMTYKLAKKSLARHQPTDFYYPVERPCAALADLLGKEYTKELYDDSVPDGLVSVPQITAKLAVAELFSAKDLSSLLSEKEPGENKYYWKLAKEWKRLREKYPISRRVYDADLSLAELLDKYDVVRPEDDDNNRFVLMSGYKKGEWLAVGQTA